MNPSVRATTINAEFNSDMVIGDLRINEVLMGSPDIECCKFGHLETGDTLCALGFRSGGRRRVRAATVVDGRRYVLVREGWYSWPTWYVHVV